MRRSSASAGGAERRQVGADVSVFVQQVSHQRPAYVSALLEPATFEGRTTASR